MSFYVLIESHFLFKLVFSCLVRIGKVTQNKTTEQAFPYLLQWTAWENKGNHNPKPEKGILILFNSLLFTVIWWQHIQCCLLSISSCLITYQFTHINLLRDFPDFLINLQICLPCQPWSPQKSEPCLLNAVLKQDHILIMCLLISVIIRLPPVSFYKRSPWSKRNYAYFPLWHQHTDQGVKRIQL